MRHKTESGVTLEGWSRNRLMNGEPFAPGITLGARYEGEQQACFLVWAPKAEKLELHLLEPAERIVPLKRLERGYHQAYVEGIESGATYVYRLNGEQERPDPASRSQPQGVHGPSAIVEPEFAWSDQGWFGLPLSEQILYELHVGTFTPEGTFEAIIPQLAGLKDLGVTTIQLMPIAQFPGSRNWGYDAVFPYAVQNSYGGPYGLKRLIDACHQEGLAVVLDVVYNHLGPEGNYLHDFAPYFTSRYQIPWGASFNFDAEHSDEVRRYFIENALYWQTQFHVDGLRLDAIHAIKDFSAVPFLQLLSRTTRQRAEELNRRFCLVAESDLNDRRVISAEAMGGYGLDAQWSDDFHHCLHVLLTGEGSGYYADFGGTRLLAKVFREGYAYTGQFSRFRKRCHGNRPLLNASKQFVVYSQNHDQIGNRIQGERLSQLVGLEQLKVAAGAVLLSPFIPLLFMGEEYGETAPFEYFISHADHQLVEAVRQGRREEFSSFGWQGEVPDPLSEGTFQRCVLKRETCTSEPSHQMLYAFYRELIQMRETTPAIAWADKDSLEVQALESERTLVVSYGNPVCSIWILFSFAKEVTALALDFPIGGWNLLLDSAQTRWGGPGSSIPDRVTSTGRVDFKISPVSLAVFQRRASI
jgi:maltooligosyltrehalose trehalohydrolase